MLRSTLLIAAEAAAAGVRSGRRCGRASGAVRHFQTLNAEVDTHAEQFKQNLARAEEMVAHLKERTTYAEGGGGEKAIVRHTQKNKKMLVRERVKRLLDDESGGAFLELNPLCGLGLYGADVQGGGVVTGIGKIHGRDVMIIANDATVSAGASYPITVKKSLRAQEIARQNHLPCYYIVDSAGAFLPMQADIFPDRDHGGRCFFNQARLSAVGIPQVAIVPGSCTAGGAYTCTMSDEAIIVKDLGQVYLGGPPLVKAATGEIVTDNELGGAEVHCELSGCTDHYAEDEIEALRIGRDIAQTLPVWEFSDGISKRATTEVPVFSKEELLGLMPADADSEHHEAPDMRSILARVVDGSKLHEHRARYGKTLITGFARVDGHLVGVVANNGPIIGGAADSEPASMTAVAGASHSPAAIKGAHFVELCNQRQIPILFFVDCRDAPIRTRRGPGVIRDLAKMTAAVANVQVPKITIITGKNEGIGAYAMGGRANDASFVFSWPSALHSLGNSGSPANVLPDEEFDGIDDPSSVALRREAECPTRDAWYATARGWDDGVIDPRDTRKTLVRTLEIVKRQLHPETKNDGPPSLGVLRL